MAKDGGDTVKRHSRPTPATGSGAEGPLENSPRDRGIDSRDQKGSGGLRTVTVPEDFESIFLKAQEYVERYFRIKEENPCQGFIEISGERYILIRAASMSKEFFDLVCSLYKDRGEQEARAIAFGFLFDIAHSIGKADAKSFFAKMGVDRPIDRLSAGPVHFAYTGWAYVDILPSSNPTPDEDYYLIYDHPFSFEADTWLKSGEKPDFHVCAMNGGYSSGWCEESFGVSLVAAEVECRAKGDDHCRFIMAPPSKIKEYVALYSEGAEDEVPGVSPIDIPEFFQRKRLEDELKRHRDHLEELVQERTETLVKTNRRLQREITERNQAEDALKRSETMLRAIFDQTFQFIGVLRLDGTIVKVNKPAMDYIGTNEVEIEGRPFWESPWWENSEKEQKRLREAIYKAALGELVRFETRHRAPDGNVMNVDFSIKPVKDEKERIIFLIAEGRDISDLKRAMEDLKRRESQLKTQSQNLEETNIALKVVLKQMEEKKKEEKENILSNMKQLIMPYLNRLKNGPVNEGQKILLEKLVSNLNDITSPLIGKLSSNFLDLTPMEIRIAHLVKEGLSNKEIADLLGIALNTVTSHRYKIRTKLGLRNKGANLRAFLLSFDE